MKTNYLLVLSSLLLVSACGKQKKTEYKKAEAVMPMETVAFADEKEIGLGEMVEMEETMMPVEEEPEIEILELEGEPMYEEQAAMPGETEEEIDITLVGEDVGEESVIDIK